MDIKYDLHIPYAKLQQKGVKPSAMIFYGIILYHCYYQDKTYVTNGSLAKEFGCSERQAQNYVKELKDSGVIAIEMQRDETGALIRVITPMVISSLVYGKREKPSSLRKQGFDELQF